MRECFFKGFFSQACLDCSIAGVVGVMCGYVMRERERERERERKRERVRRV